MKERELKLSILVSELQSEVNILKRERDVARASYHSMKEERDKYLRRAMALERFFSDNMRDFLDSDMCQ